MLTTSGEHHLSVPGGALCRLCVPVSRRQIQDSPLSSIIALGSNPKDHTESLRGTSQHLQSTAVLAFRIHEQKTPEERQQKVRSSTLTTRRRRVGRARPRFPFYPPDPTATLSLRKPKFRASFKLTCRLLCDFDENVSFSRSGSAP